VTEPQPEAEAPPQDQVPSHPESAPDPAAAAPDPSARYGDATEDKIAEVVNVAARYGGSSIIALAGVPGTGKSYVGQIAAQRIADEPTRVREIQFHPSTTYEEFVEGLRMDKTGGIDETPGLFSEWNQQALADPHSTYVLLIDELTRAKVNAVMGELLTFIEDRSRAFTTIYSRRHVRVASNLVSVATYNPTDRSAIEIDGALLRRLRVIRFDPDEGQLREMLSSRLPGPVVDRLAGLFAGLRAKHKDFDDQMPFGHGIFAEVQQEAPDLYQLWEQRIRFFLHRPLVSPHPYADDIRVAYPWHDPNYLERAQP